MKLKVLPPTLRKNRRYLTLDIRSEVKVSKNDLVSLIWNACLMYYGELGVSDFALWLMRVYEDYGSSDYFHYRAILACQRGYEDKIRTALALMYKFNGKKVNISCIGLSGTVKSSMDKYF